MYRVSQKIAVKSNLGNFLRKCNFNFFNVKIGLFLLILNLTFPLIQFYWFLGLIINSKQSRTLRIPKSTVFGQQGKGVCSWWWSHGLPCSSQGWTSSRIFVTQYPGSYGSFWWFPGRANQVLRGEFTICEGQRLILCLVMKKLTDMLTPKDLQIFLHQWSNKYSFWYLQSSQSMIVGGQVFQSRLLGANYYLVRNILKWV